MIYSDANHITEKEEKKMKKLYKRIIAVALCLALTAALVPAAVFADDDNGFSLPEYY